IILGKVRPLSTPPHRGSSTGSDHCSKQIRGSLFGSSNGQHDIPRLLELYALGQLKLDELITTEYDLEDINQGYEDMRSGRNIRGVIRY
ncbi:hypothetical protein ACUY3U_22555, partial [Gordonia amicalis]